MTGCSLVDRLWFVAHPDEDHRIRPATALETAAAEAAIRNAYLRLLSIVRSSDGATVTYAFRLDDDIDRACSFELASWFADDLAKAGSPSI